MPQLHDIPGHPGEYLSRAQVAALFSVSPSTVTRWADEGKLAHVRTLGGHRRYLADDVFELVRNGAKETRMETLTTKIPRMYADHHVSAVQQALAGLTGIQAARASAATQELSVVFDPEQTSADAILARLAARGYPSESNGQPAGEHYGRKDPAWAQLGLRMTATHPADR